MRFAPPRKTTRYLRFVVPFRRSEYLPPLPVVALPTLTHWVPCLASTLTTRPSTPVGPIRRAPVSRVLPPDLAARSVTAVPLAVTVAAGVTFFFIEKATTENVYVSP